MVISQRDIQLLFIGAAATKTTANNPTSLNVGEIGIFTPAGVRVTEASAATLSKFRICAKQADGTLVDSGIINKKDIKKAVRKVYEAATQMSVNIGYNGTSGSIDEINDNNYTVRINLRQARVSNHGGLYIKSAYYKSDVNATQFEIASNLLLNLVNEISKEPDLIYIPTMLCNDAGAALGAGPETLTTTFGSRWVVASGAGHTVVAGDVIRIGGTATTTPVYKVLSVSGANIELESPYMGASGSSIAGEVITAANAATADFGIVFTGIAQPYRVGHLEQDNNANIFDVTLENFGSTTFNVATVAAPGSGTERQVKSLEFFLQGNEGDFLRTPAPFVFEQRSNASGNYDLITLMTEEIATNSIVAGPIRKVFTLAIPETAPNYAIAATADDITDVLEVLAGTASGALAVT